MKNDIEWDENCADETNAVMVEGLRLVARAFGKGSGPKEGWHDFVTKRVTCEWLAALEQLDREDQRDRYDAWGIVFDFFKSRSQSGTEAIVAIEQARENLHRANALREEHGPFEGGCEGLEDAACYSLEIADPVAVVGFHLLDCAAEAVKYIMDASNALERERAEGMVGPGLTKTPRAVE